MATAGGPIYLRQRCHSTASLQSIRTLAASTIDLDRTHIMDYHTEYYEYNTGISKYQVCSNAHFPTERSGL